MAFEPTLPHIIRAAGALLWLPLGIALLLRTPRGTRAWWLGAFFVPASLAILLPNVVVMEVPIDPNKVFVSYIFGAVAFIVACGALVALLLAEQHASRALWLGVAAAATGATSVAIALLLGAADSARAWPADVADAASSAALVAGAALLAAVGAHAAAEATRLRDRPDHARGLAWLAAALCIFPAVYAAGVIDTLRPGFAEPRTPLQLVAGLALTAPALVALVLLARAPRAIGRRPAVVLFAIVLLAAVARIAIAPDLGDRGIARTIAFGIMACAFLGTGLLQNGRVPARARRSVLFTAALSALLVVAQVMQNFFEAQYSLVMGGIVSGALLVAARPIERALDGRGHRRDPDDDLLGVYRDAARRSLRDGLVTREEEMHLARLARHLSIPPDVALRIRHEVEDELRPGAR